MSPIVTVICTCYNHASYVKEALSSVMEQTYPHIQLIVVDNFSTDTSVAVISEFLSPYPGILFLQNKKNKGICRAFNEAAALAKGSYLIDLSADDVLMPDRIERQVAEFERLPEEYGLIYSNVAYIDPQGRLTGYGFQEHDTPPSGDIFAPLLEKHFLPSPTTLFKTSVFFSLGGYNETLAFEDFDYWIRCARNYSFGYLNEVTTKKRVLPQSLSSQFYDTSSSVMLESTFSTFLWASTQLRNSEEKKALQQGATYYFRQSILLGHFKTAKNYYSLLSTPFMRTSLATLFCLGLFHFKWNVSSYYKKYLEMTR